jgi:hypothetical protein
VYSISTVVLVDGIRTPKCRCSTWTILANLLLWDRP